MKMSEYSRPTLTFSDISLNDECHEYDPDKVFKNFNLIEFPPSFVGLFCSLDIDMGVDLTSCAYLKTFCNGQLMKMTDARNLSASHRSFEISLKCEKVVQFSFKPTNECIAKAKLTDNYNNRFVIDLRLIQINDKRCCDKEIHGEIGRYYISGRYEYLEVAHIPNIVDFGDVMINSKVFRKVRIRNKSNFIATRMQYVRVPAFEVTPAFFLISPNSSKYIDITFKPTCLKVEHKITFQIRNPSDIVQDKENPDKNYLMYGIPIKSNIIIRKKPITTVAESLHKINEKDIKYTFLENELITRIQRKKVATNFLEMSKKTHAKKIIKPKTATGRLVCYSDGPFVIKPNPDFFCKIIDEKISTYETLNVLILPFSINFGRIGLESFGEQEIDLHNNTKYTVTLDFHQTGNLFYTEKKLDTFRIKLKGLARAKVSLFCFGFVEGTFIGSFDYSLENKYHRKHPYTYQVDSPKLMIRDRNLKFGMINSDNFVSAVPLRLYNFFNVPVDFQWEDIHADTPFTVIPTRGQVPKHSCKICDVIYVCSQTKTKTHEIDCTSISNTKTSTSIELSVITRKLSIKFLQAAIFFKDIPLNLEIVERVKLENSSREMAFYHVVEPLIPGFKINPMSGSIRPKMIITFEITVQIACILEFAFDVLVKINNKENVLLPVSGNVVEPKIIIQPKNIYLPRVPCHMINYVPVMFQNTSYLRSVVEVLDTGDENIFNVYIAHGNEKQRVNEFVVEGGQTKTVLIKVCDIFRREYEMYIPFKINGLLGPPDKNSSSIELYYYTQKYEQLYENNSKVKIKTLHKDISFCRLSGVITVPWIEFTVDNFEIDYVPQSNNSIVFKMINVSKYNLPITIMTTKLSPSFTLDLISTNNDSIINESYIKFVLDSKESAEFLMVFHPKGFGRFVSTAVLFLDKYMTLPYSNLTFIGKRQTPAMIPSTYIITFPPCRVNDEISRTFSLRLMGQASLDEYAYVTKRAEPNLVVSFINLETVTDFKDIYTIVTVKITMCCTETYSRRMLLTFTHICGAGCDIELNFCFTYCPLTLHTLLYADEETNPFPYYPLKTQSKLHMYMEKCTDFLETWMFQQGFRRDLYPEIPDTFHAISSSISSQANAKTKGINVSFMNFLRRIAGPLVKHLRKVTSPEVDDSFKIVKEIHDTYKEIISLIKSRGGHVWSLEAKYLLSHDQFELYCQNVTPSRNIDIIENQELIANIELFERLNKQCWFDFILQTYKVFVFDSCFFECVCVSLLPRDVIKVIVDWYNSNIASCYYIQIEKIIEKKTVTNLTHDLIDGTAIMSAILNYCPFFKEHFAIFCEVKNKNVGDIVHNACLIIEAMNQLKLFFPLNSTDFIEPNYMQMLFLSVHLYVTLPMFKQKDVIEFSPPNLKSSTRLLSINPTSQEPLTYNYTILTTKHNFVLEKSTSGDNGKKVFLIVKYEANFIEEQKCVLLVHGYNKTRIFDTYIVFLLYGHVGSLQPYRKCKVTGPLYKPNRVDVMVSSPFNETADFKLFITDTEPTLPVSFKTDSKPSFYIRRLHLIDNVINLTGIPKESGQDIVEHKLYMQIICLSSQAGNSWVWFRSPIGEFYIKVTSQPRWDIATETIQARLKTWPIDPCSCGESCECYRSTALIIPHRVDSMVKSLKSALMETASEIMLHIFDRLIETTTGKIILNMLFEEGGTDMSDIRHILKDETTFKVTSKTLLSRLEKVTLAQHTDGILVLPVTLTANEKSEKHSVVLTSECGMDIRTYRIIFSKEEQNAESNTSHTSS